MSSKGKVNEKYFPFYLKWVTEGKGDKDRRTVLPESLKDDLLHKLSSVREIYEQDRKDNINGVYLPGALSLSG